MKLSLFNSKMLSTRKLRNFAKLTTLVLAASFLSPKPAEAKTFLSVSAGPVSQEGGTAERIYGDGWIVPGVRASAGDDNFEAGLGFKGSIHFGRLDEHPEEDENGYFTEISISDEDLLYRNQFEVFGIVKMGGLYVGPYTGYESLYDRTESNQQRIDRYTGESRGKNYESKTPIAKISVPYWGLMVGVEFPFEKYRGSVFVEGNYSQGFGDRDYLKNYSVVAGVKWNVEETVKEIEKDIKKRRSSK